MFLLYLMIFVITSTTSISFGMELGQDFSSEIITHAASNDNLELLTTIASSTNLESKHALCIIHAYAFKVKTEQQKKYYYSRAEKALSIMLSQTKQMPITMLNASTLDFLNAMAAYCENSAILKLTLNAISEHYVYDRKKIKQKFGQSYTNGWNICSFIENGH